MGTDVAKAAAATAAAALVESGMIVGLGTGTTAHFFVHALASRLQNGDLQNVRGVATSRASEVLALQGNIPLVPLTAQTRPDVTIDGADEVDSHLNLIKGGGGALVREKLVASASRQMIVIADDSKDKTVLGAYPLPVAVFPFGWDITLARIEAAFPGVAPVLRGGPTSPYITDDGLFILDCRLQQIPDPAETLATFRALSGVAEVGLFVAIASRVLFGHDDGTVTERSLPSQNSIAF